MKPLWLLALVLALSSCAPMIVGRTPEPAAPGTFDVTIGGGYPLSLTTIPVCNATNPDSYNFHCSEGFASADYYPLGSPFIIMVSQGLEGNTEINYTLGLAQPLGYPMLRFGGKTLFYEGGMKLAADYGLFGGATNVGLDVGLLASMPLAGAELYGALRGFGNGFYGLAGDISAVSGALTLGAEAEVSGTKGIFAELTFATSSYNGVDVYQTPPPPAYEAVPLDVQQIGFSIMPAIGIRF